MLAVSAAVLFTFGALAIRASTIAGNLVGSLLHELDIVAQGWQPGDALRFDPAWLTIGADLQKQGSAAIYWISATVSLNWCSAWSTSIDRI